MNLIEQFLVRLYSPEDACSWLESVSIVFGASAVLVEGPFRIPNRVSCCL